MKTSLSVMSKRGLIGLVVIPCMLGLAAWSYVVIYGARLTLRPAVVTSCHPSAQVSRVSWVVHVPGVSGISLYVHGVGREPKLLLHGATSGSTLTGKWVSEGLTVEMRSQTGMLLARRTVEMVPCPTSA